MGKTLKVTGAGVRLVLALLLCAALQPGALLAAEIPVRFPEGSIQGFLVLRAPAGKPLAHGVVVASVQGREIRRRTSFLFKDGSTLEEVVVYSQEGVYTLRSYRLDRRGPAFPKEMRVSLDRASRSFRVEAQDHKGGPKEVAQGEIDLPADTYNGMLFTVVKDLPKGARETVHYVAFMPEPRIIELEMIPVGQEKVPVGGRSMSATHYRLVPGLGLWMRLFATVFGKVPQEGHVWIIDGEVPAFVGSEGPWCPEDPVWRIDLVSPARP